MLLLGQFLLLAPITVTAQTTDSTRLVREARRAAQSYEQAIRRHAPLVFSGYSSDQCVEYVGRFCIIDDTGPDSLPAEPQRIRAARDTAIARLERAAARVPGLSDIVFSLLRYLVLAGRPEKAVDVARTYAQHADSIGDGHMALGFALHHARRTEEAKRELEGWMATLPEREQAKMRDLRWLLSSREQRRYRTLTRNERTAYEARVWNYADPLFSTPGNELWTDHLARFASGRLIREGAVDPMGGWGTDVEQLIVRFGDNVLVTRAFASGTSLMSYDYTEHWHPELRTLLPAELDSALIMRPRLDTIWPLDSVPSRSGHVPPTIRRMQVLEHQVAVFADELRIVGVVLRGDTLAKNLLAGAVFFLDSALNVVGRSGAEGCLSCDPADSAMLIADVHVPAEARYYSAELYDPSSGFAARARYRLERPDGPLSAILLAQAFEHGQLPVSRDPAHLLPLSRPVVSSGQRFGVYAEIDNRTGERRMARVEIELTRLDRGSAIRRAVGWVGNALGVTSPRSPNRLGWDVEVHAAAVTAVPVTLDPGPLEAGTYRITMTLKGDADTSDVVSTRDFAMISSRPSSSRRP